LRTIFYIHAMALFLLFVFTVTVTASFAQGKEVIREGSERGNLI